MANGIINGLFAGRSGISSHGSAIAVVGDNISNANTPGFKAGRSEFADLVAGGQAAGRIIGSGSSLAAVATLFDQGTLEFTGRALDLAVDGNGFFVVQQGNERFYTRAGNFKVDEAGFLVNQGGLKVLGFPASGTGALEQINVNTISQSGISTGEVSISGNVDAGGNTYTAIPAADLAGAVPASTVTYADLNDQAAFSTVVDVFDSLGTKHTVSLFFYKPAAPVNEYQVRAYVDGADVDPGPVVDGEPRQITTAGGTAASGTFILDFNTDGSLNAGSSTSSLSFRVPWNNGAEDGTGPTPADFTIDLSSFTQFSSPGSISSVVQDGQGIGNVTSLVIGSDGSLFAKLSNGQTANIGTIGLVNFASPEGLIRIGNNLLQQSPSSGEAVVGRAEAGTFGSISSGSIELSTVDIANEFVKLITLQRGFQANSRIITTINQLLNEIIQLA